MVVDIEPVERIAGKPRFDRMVSRRLETMREGDRLLAPGRDVDRALLKPLAVDKQIDLDVMRLAAEVANVGLKDDWTVRRVDRLIRMQADNRQILAMFLPEIDDGDSSRFGQASQLVADLPPAGDRVQIPARAAEIGQEIDLGRRQPRDFATGAGDQFLDAIERLGQIAAAVREFEIADIFDEIVFIRLAPGVGRVVAGRSGC